MGQRLLLLSLTLVCSTTWAFPQRWPDIATDPSYKKSLTREQTFRRWMQGTGKHQMFVVSDRFAFVFDPKGRSLGAFDLSMEYIGFRKMVLGSIGIGAISMRDLFGRYRKFKDRAQEVLDNDGDVSSLNMEEPALDEFDVEFKKVLDEIEANHGSVQDLDKSDVERGYKAFAELEFSDEWIQKKQGGSGLIKNGDFKKNGFRPASFSMADLRLTEEQKEAVYPILRQFSMVLFRKDLEKKNLGVFMAQFKMDWNAKNQEFGISVDPNIQLMQSRRPERPGMVLNYLAPDDIVSFKHRLRNIERWGMIGEAVLGLYGRILGIYVSRVVNGLQYQMESHENQLLTILEAAQRGQYKIEIPVEDLKAFIDTSVLMLYLNKTIRTKDVADAVAKREKQLAAEKENAEKNLKWLTKRYRVEPWSDNRFATLFDKDHPEKRLGVASLAIKGRWLVKTPSFHYIEKANWYKTANRLGLEVFTDAVRVYLAGFVGITDWIYKLAGTYIGFSLYLPSAMWDMLFRGRAYTEIGYEGMMIGHINESLQGNLAPIPGYVGEDAKELKKWIYRQRLNPFEIKEGQEVRAINFYRENLKEILRRNDVESLF